jgi:hypothetical protein
MVGRLQVKNWQNKEEMDKVISQMRNVKARTWTQYFGPQAKLLNIWKLYPMMF